MPAQLGFTNVTTTGRQSVQVAPGDNTAAIALSSTGAWTATATIQANPFTAVQDPSGYGWQNIASMRTDTLAIETTPTVTSATARTWIANIGAFQQIGLNVTVITGTLPMNVSSYFQSGGTGIVEVTSSASTGLTVGPNGATNPSFQVDASTSSAADGVKITGLAAGSGGTIATITGGTNAPLNINAAGSGDINMNAAGTGNTVFTTGLTVASGKNIVSTTTTGTSFGSATTQKVSLYGVTPIVQPVNSVDVFTGLVNLGLRASGGTAATSLPGALNLTDANIVCTTTTGTSFGSATTQKISFYGVTPITQPAASSATSVTGAAGTSTGVSLDTTFTGGGTAAYTIGGIVVKLKALGLLAT